MWKDLTFSLAGVVAIALLIGLVFGWLYPQVALSAELGGLFLLVALVLRLVGGWLLGLARRGAAQPGPPRGPGP